MENLDFITLLQKKGKDKMHILLLHIGTDKTGTTSLQRFLTENREQMEKKSDWSYPDLSRRKIDNLSDLLVDRGENWRSTTLRLRNRFYDELEKVLEKKNVILSSEQFYIRWDDSIKILNEVASRFPSLKIVLYLRRQDLYWESLWGENVKWGPTRDPKQAFQRRDYRDRCDYYGRIGDLCKIIKKEQLILRLFEGKSEFAKFDVVDDFLEILGLSEKKEYFVFGRTENERLSRDCLELMRFYYAVRKEQFAQTEPEWNLERLFTDISCSIEPGKMNRGGYLSPAERICMLEEYEENNRRIAKTFFEGRDTLFYDKRVDLPYYNPQYDSFQECIIRTFFTFYLQQKNVLSFLEKARNRKIAFWGGGRRCRRLFRKGHRPDIIIDNDPEMRESNVDGISIVSPEEIDDWKRYCIAVTVLQYEEVREQCVQMGLTEGEDFFNAYDVYL